MMSRIISLSIDTTASKNRIEKVDFLRGLAMLLVLLHHSGFPFGSFILAFHMPLFFVISGWLAYIGGY